MAETNDRASAYHFARQLENQGDCLFILIGVLAGLFARTLYPFSLYFVPNCTPFIYLTSTGQYNDAITFYASSGCYNHSIRLARAYNLDTELMRYVLFKKNCFDCVWCKAGE